MRAVVLLSSVVVAVVTGYPGGFLAEPVAAPAEVGQEASASPREAFLRQYCVTCHRGPRARAGLALDERAVDDVGQAPEMWEKVVRKLRAGAMPPVGSPRPDRTTYAAVASSLEAELDGVGADRPSDGVPAVHRLNRVEYTNAVRDLLGVEVDGRALLPTDESGYGFDNIADVLAMSPALLERYILAAQKVSRLAVGDSSQPPGIETYKVSPFLIQDHRTDEELPFGSRGGAVIRHYFPQDGEYVVRVRLRRANANEAIWGLKNREQLDIRLDGERLELFTLGGECVGSSEPRCIRPPGIISLSEYERTADDHLEARFATHAGQGRVGVTFVRRTAAAVESGGVARPPGMAADDSYGETRDMDVATIEIEGPLSSSGLGDTPSRRKIFVCRPEAPEGEEPCASSIVRALIRKAFRRPISDLDVEPLMKLYGMGRREGDFETGIKYAIEGILSSPHFLFRVEAVPADASAGAEYRVSDLDLASRLSFFLWSSLPDEQLLDLAGAGRLGDQVVLEEQTLRMLEDPRAKALVSNFVAQWLHLRDLRVVVPDPKVYPDFDDSLRQAFQRETELFLESQLFEDRSVVELLTADYTFANERLARFYEIPYVYGSHFRRVTLTDPNRRGLLGHGSVLTVTSYSTRTSPVVRGIYLLKNVFGAPPPPPPPDVPALKENGEGGAPPTSVRARLEQHRRNAVCAVCHSRIDPLGFALENFDGIGRWRETDAGQPVDTAGVLPDGTAFNGPAEFRAALLSRRELFVQTATENLLTYALGRGVTYRDMPTIRRILRDASDEDFRWSALVLGIVKSRPFHVGRVPDTFSEDEIVAQVR